MFKLKENKGFTLIELAIVLVIIGLIVGAVLKGQDLIDNAKAKKFISKARGWEVSQWTYLDRKGVFAGDSDNNGKIDADIDLDLIAAAFTNPPYEGGGTPVNTITMGSLTFYVFFGTDGGDNDGKNVMSICVASDCDTAFSAPELVFIESLDVSIDGSANGADGQIIGNNAPPATIPAGDWEGTYAAAAITPAAWTANTSKALVYYFDAKR